MKDAENGILDELWRVKREIAAEHPSVAAYFREFMREQFERERQGARFVRPDSQHLAFATS